MLSFQYYADISYVVSLADPFHLFIYEIPILSNLAHNVLVGNAVGINWWYC